MSDCKLNTTKDYHVNELNSLGWELTVCNALYPEHTPLRKILSCNDSHGHLLYDYLNRLMPMEKINKIIEIGGGYGYLMKDFFDRDRSLQTCMLDISPVLLQKQKETLCGFSASFRQEDFLDTNRAILTGFDLAILNENLGDFPTLTNIKHNIFASAFETDDMDIQTLLKMFEKYDFVKPLDATFNFNIGAIQALEKLCASGIPYIYLGEHSCEAEASEAFRAFLNIRPTGNPEKISLKGHDEYTIKFSQLQKVAHTFNYKTIRGPFADFIQVEFTEKLKFILASRGGYSDENEIICHFVEDLYKYEYLILIKS